MGLKNLSAVVSSFVLSISCLAGWVDPPTDISCNSIPGWPSYGGCTITCDCEDSQGHKCVWCDPFFHPDGCKEPDDWTKIGDCYHNLMSDHHGSNYPKDWTYWYECYGTAICLNNFPVPERLVPTEGHEQCEQDCWDTYLANRLTIETTWSTKILSCPSTLFPGGDPSRSVDCYLKKLYECGCMDNFKDGCQTDLNLEYQKYRDCYWACDPCENTLTSEQAAPTAEYDINCGNIQCYYDYLTNRSNADAVYDAEIADANGNCDKIAEAVNELQTKDSLYRQQMSDCCNGIFP